MMTLDQLIDFAVKAKEIHGGHLPVHVSLDDDESFGGVACEVGDDDTGDSYSPAFFICGNY